MKHRRQVLERGKGRPTLLKSGKAQGALVCLCGYVVDSWLFHEDSSCPDNWRMELTHLAKATG